MVPGSRPVIMSQYSGKADFITPSIIKKYSELNEKYLQKMDHLFKLINRFLENSKSSEYASYLLPNAFPIRFYESGDLLNLHHKWKSRLCYNAQEEIFHASCEEVSDVYRVHPEIASWIKAPCWIRFMGEERPYCPEGDKFCGVQVWKKESLNEYQRTI
jgi:thymidylate synthase ThyX